MKTSRYKTAALTALIVLLGVTASFAATVSVTVSKVEGTVETRASAGAAWTKVSSGAKLSAGAFVKTGSASSCVLTWGGGHVIKLQALTSLDISKLDRAASGSENSGFSVSQGKINAHVAKLQTKDSTFQVKTPTAVAGVRGTDLFVNVAEDQTSTFGVIDGQIYVETDGVETVIDQDFIVIVNPAGEAGEPTPMPEEMKQDAYDQANEVKQESKPENESDSAATPSAKEETTAGEPAPAEPVAPEADVADDAAGAMDAVTNDIIDTIDQQVVNDIVEAAQEQSYITGQFEAEIYIEP